MEEVTKKRKFPYQVHIVIGLLWVLIGIFLQSGWIQTLWIGAGLVFLVIGWLSKRK